ncbi:MAG TPA: DUF1552 domain-containing protein [Polyangiaceae bacterium]|nr:DUF1552 domain-containing protein [Polyangiaceae bacterium]
MIGKRTRRHFLRGMGAGVAALPFLRLVETSYAQDAGEALPQRFIGVYHPHGIAAELFTMRDSDSETNFDLGYADCPLQPFDDAATYGKSYKDRIVAIEGLDLLSDTNGHNSAGTILTGSRIVGGTGGIPENSSVDQFLAVENNLGDPTLVTSVALAVGNKELSGRETLSFGTGGVPISKIIDPGLAFDFLFKQAVVGSDPAAQAAAARQQQLGLSLIDFVRGDVQRLRARVGPFETQKLDQHLDALRSLEKKVQALGTPSSCTPPARPSAFPELERYNGGEPYFDAITDAHIDLLGLAMGCDITRFATLCLGDLSYANNPLGLPEDNHGGMAHTYSASALGYEGRPVGNGGDPATWQLLAKFNRYIYGKVARLMQRLDEGGILDSTLIVASSDMGNPAAHDTRDVPTVLAGGANGKIQMGRRIKFRTDCPLGTDCDKTGDDYLTQPNNQLLVSIVQAFGVDTDDFGRQPLYANSSGPLPGL